ncbi:DUF3300 domain-containing protein [Aestuariibacter sp. A3R04]|uniref:DUF3300 domain-containing protein n=1 Tax=Aestuariibacter sp. A3R04 TaxID=2841571 RepID=UPI001C099D78|nr:DUF3300 domain-containing protein [Aestuariibacter sp. A3R04]MBU3023686.1 DUF3300 domain-containing protein [Aestuariibacter sp. A3R04]
MTRFTTAVLVTILAASTVTPYANAGSDTQYETQQDHGYSDAELDSLLAPVALYPDTILTHILIAATYPLDVVAADRWRQKHLHLDAEKASQAADAFSWDPSVKALVPFTDILRTLSDDLDWLQALGDNVLISQSRVLARVQVLRQHALNAGSLVNNEYQRIERDRDIIVIEPARKEIVYVPFYDTRVVYGRWWHPVAPVYWYHPVHYRVTGAPGFYWSPSVRLSTHFYFGGIHWQNRHVVITRKPVRRFYYGNDIKRVYSRDYQPWQHRADHHRVRYSNTVLRAAPKRYSTATVTRQVNYTPQRPRRVTVNTTRTVTTERPQYTRPKPLTTNARHDVVQRSDYNRTKPVSTPPKRDKPSTRNYARGPSRERTQAKPRPRNRD